MTSIPYVKWRNGRPRFSPGPRERSLGFSSEDLRHAGGAWFTEEMARAWSERRVQEIYERRGSSPAPSLSPAEARAYHERAHRSVRGYVYFLLSGAHVKIGFSANPFNRATALRTGLAVPIDGFITVPGTRADEHRLHHQFRALKVKGEWFVIDRSIVATAVKLFVNRPRP